MTERQEEYVAYLQTDAWRAIAGKVKERAGHRCQICNSGNRLEVHHRTYAHIFNEAEYLDDLVCLCRGCHGLYHASKKRTKTATPATNKPKKTKLEKKEARFFRKSAVTLGIKARVLAEMGRTAVADMLTRYHEERRVRRAASRERRRLRREARLLP